jgi:hypothetical protein
MGDSREQDRKMDHVLHETAQLTKDYDAWCELIQADLVNEDMVQLKRIRLIRCTVNNFQMSETHEKAWGLQLPGFVTDHHHENSRPRLLHHDG